MANNTLEQENADLKDQVTALEKKTKLLLEKVDSQENAIDNRVDKNKYLVMFKGGKSSQIANTENGKKIIAAYNKKMKNPGCKIVKIYEPGKGEL